jgi:N-acetylmuramoyl-L-alanine amidase
MIIQKQFASHNFDSREGEIDMIVIHSTHISFEESIHRLCHPTDFKVSAHYVIDLDGSIYRLVEEEHRAWHAGVSYWRGREKLNNFSIGIELVDTDAGLQRLSGFTVQQMHSVIALCKDIVARYGIKPHNIVAHSDIAPSRKDDPGEEFNWQLLASQGVGLYPTIDSLPDDDEVIADYQDTGDHVAAIQVLLAKYGYQVEGTGVFDDATRDAVIAFKRHFQPDYVTAEFSMRSRRILEAIVYRSSE